MIMSLLAIALVAAIGYVWVMAGFFSAAIHMLCVLVAGAIAFALWEPIAYLILDNVAGNKGFLSFLPGMAWGVALVVPFCVSLALLRVATNKAISATPSATDGRRRNSPMNRDIGPPSFRKATAPAVLGCFRGLPTASDSLPQVTPVGV